MPTRSIYEFEDADVHVTLTFMTPALPDDLDVFSRPLSYITWESRSWTGKRMPCRIYDSTSSQLAVNQTSEKVEWARETAGKSDRAPRRHAGSAGARLLRRRPSHQLGLCLCRRAAPAKPRRRLARTSLARGVCRRTGSCRRRTTRKCRARSNDDSR